MGVDGYPLRVVQRGSRMLRCVYEVVHGGVCGGVQMIAQRPQKGVHRDTEGVCRGTVGGGGGMGLCMVGQ